MKPPPFLPLVLALTALASCTVTTVRIGGGPLVTLEAARAAVIHHWDVNRQALRSTTGTQARMLIDQVETGDALKMDEAIIAREADARGVNPVVPPPIPAATGVRVFVPRQTAYPASFLSIRTEAQTDRTGAANGQSIQVLEIFRRASATEEWKNSGYAEVGADLTSKLDAITLDKDGYASFVTGTPDGAALSTDYTAYMTAHLGGKAAPDSKVQAGLLTDQFATKLQKALASVPTVKGVATFTASNSQEGVMLKTTGEGRLVIFDNNYDVVTTPTGSGCVSGTPGSATPGNYASVTEHFLQNVGALVTSGGDVSVVAESDSPVSIDTTPCAGGGRSV